MEVPPNQLAAGGLVAALVLTLLFAFSYVGGLHDPGSGRRVRAGRPFVLDGVVRSWHIRGLGCGR
jgi:hypothetical protein